MAFTCDIIEEPSIRAKLERIAKIPSLVATYCLPNIHPKAGLESPPQFVAATRGTIVPMLSAPAMNCGMSVFATNLSKSDFSPEFLQIFAHKMRQNVLPRIGRKRTFLQWLGFAKRPRLKYDLTEHELEDFFINGASAALKKYGLPAEEKNHIEYGGSLFSEEEKHAVDLRELIPRSSYTNGRHEMGYNFGGNHFLEIHAVEKIVEPEIAKRWNLREGQILLFYHGGGGHATYHLGRYFARREKNSFSEKIVLFFLKLGFHFTSLEGLKNFRTRWRYYFSRRPFPEIPLHSREGRRLMRSIKIGLNYGYAFRVALLRRIIDAMPHDTHVSFLWDAAHNSIVEEAVAGQKLIVHRQDAARVFPEKPLMITGLSNTLSFIGMGSNEKDKTLSSVTPSATKIIEEYVALGKSKEERPGHVSYISKRKSEELIVKKHMTSEGLFDVVQKFEKDDIIRSVAYLRPLGGIKGH